MARRSEFAHYVVIDPWPEGGISIELEADAEERRALARRFDLVELRSLVAIGAFERVSGGDAICLRGHLMADVVQTCIVSLEPVAARISTPIERRYRLRGSDGNLQRAAEVLVDPDAVEEEPLEGSSLALGEVVAEELGLALDPYPRRADAYDELPELGPEVSLNGPEAEPAASPFAVLGELYQDRRGR